MHAELPSTVAIELGRKTYATLLDSQGNISELVDPFTKSVASKYEFTAFGEEKSHTKDENPWRYAGKRLDPELNLVYFGKRYYDPDLGRWLTTDPAGFADSLNVYQYALNNPFSYYDPNGEFIFMACIPFAGIFTPLVIKIFVDAVAMGIGCWGVYEGTKYAADAIGSDYTLSESTCYTLVDHAYFGANNDTYLNRNTKKHRNNKIELYMKSSQIDCDDIEDIIVLSNHNNIKGRLHLDSVLTIKLDNIAHSGQLKKIHDEGDIFSFDIYDNKVELTIH